MSDQHGQANTNSLSSSNLVDIGIVLHEHATTLVALWQALNPIGESLGPNPFANVGEPSPDDVERVLEKPVSRERKRDGFEVFTIKDERHSRYWMSQAFPVMLVVRSSAGEIRWMEVREWLKRKVPDNSKPIRQIVFQGERFDVMSVRRWRDRVLDEEFS